MAKIKQCKRCFKPMEKNPRRNNFQKQKIIFYGGQEVGTDYCEPCYNEIAKGNVI